MNNNRFIKPSGIVGRTCVFKGVLSKNLSGAGAGVGLSGCLLLYCIIRGSEGDEPLAFPGKVEF